MSNARSTIRNQVTVDHSADRLPDLEFERRMRWLFGTFIVLMLTVYARLIALEVRDGAEYRAVAAEPLVRKHAVAGIRGRILARDGTVLAYDQPVVSLALAYRWLEEPPDLRWLRSTARLRLTTAQRRDPKRVATETQRVIAERQGLHARLAELCGLTDEQWKQRTARIQHRVETIADSVDARRQAALASEQTTLNSDGTDESTAGLAATIGRSILDALFAPNDLPQAPELTIAEELTEHVVYEGLSLEVVAEIEAHPERYPGVRLVHSYRREYPQGELASHVVGYLGAVNASEVREKDARDGHLSEAVEDGHEPDDWVGRAGIERSFESQLRSQRGLIVERLDVRGKVLASQTSREAGAGRDMKLTLDPILQRSAQALLDQALVRRLPIAGQPLDESAGGAVVVMDIRNGAILAAASAPRFDPNAFVRSNNLAIQSWLTAANRPLFDRTLQMALPPGSVFKVISAAALLDAGINPLAPVDCEGYLHQPEALRCAIFRRFGVGHGPVTMVDALARSCNVYFFHHAEQIGTTPLLDWAGRFGLGQRRGIDLLGEVAGALPKVEVGAAPPDPRLVAIGQGPVTATPLQMVCLISAIANGGYLVGPHVVESAPVPPRAVPGLNADKLAVIRRGLRQAVADEQGTAHAILGSANVSIAGKTGTAETGAGQADHAWFAGYAPADEPRVAFVVVLEHAGDAAVAAGPVVARLVERMNDLEYFAVRQREIASGIVAPAVIK